MSGQDEFHRAVQQLILLGFTELEAAVYVFLVGHSPATAYGVAKGLGRPVANTYKAVESLQQKGAVLIDETGARQCEAVPPAELLGKLDRTFAAQRDSAAAALARLEPAGGSDGIYTLTSVEQVYDRATLMLRNAKDVVLGDLFPEAVSMLRSDLEAAAGRGAIVAVQTYAPVNLEGIETLLNPQASEIRTKWPGQWLCLVSDGAEYLFAYLGPDGRDLHQAIWSSSAFLAWVQHSFLVDGLRGVVLEELLGEIDSPDDAMAEAAVRASRWTSYGCKGFQELHKRFRRTSTPRV